MISAIVTRGLLFSIALTVTAGYTAGAAIIPPVPPVPVQGSDPQMVLRFSFNGGRTWSSEYSRSMGTIGAYRTRMFWNRLGAGSDCVLEVFGSDPVRICLTGANMDIELLKSPARGAPSNDGPQCTMRFSDDGGKTFSSEYSRSLGKIGEYSAVVSWNRLGAGRDRVYEVFGTDAVKICLTGAHFDAEILKS